MNADSAERWVVISALIVAGVYAYRRLTETPVSKPGLHNLAGQGGPAPLGTFATAWGVTFLGVSILASANPGLGGAFAMLIATGDFLANAPALFGDVNRHGGGALAKQGVAAGTGNAISSSGLAAGAAIQSVGVKAK